MVLLLSFFGVVEVVPETTRTSQDVRVVRIVIAFARHVNAAKPGKIEDRGKSSLRTYEDRGQR